MEINKKRIQTGLKQLPLTVARTDLANELDVGENIRDERKINRINCMDRFARAHLNDNPELNIPEYFCLKGAQSNRDGIYSL